MKNAIKDKTLVTSLSFILVILLLISCKQEQSTQKTPTINAIIVCKEDAFVEKVEKSESKLYASSVLPGTDAIQYGPENLFDKNVNTCWCPKNDGINEFVIFKIPYGIQGVRIINGLAASEKSFRENNRVKQLYLSIIAETYYPEKGMGEYDICGTHEFMSVTSANSRVKVFLEDTSKSQDIILFKIDKYKTNDKFWEDKLFNFKGSSSLYLVIGILDIYKGSKYNDTCISEIELINI